MKMIHPRDQTLQRLVDGELPPADAARLREHADDCPDCLARMLAVEETVARVRSLLPSIQPEADLWPGIAARLGPPNAELDGPRALTPRFGARPSGTLRAVAWITAAAATLTIGVAVGTILPRSADPVALEPVVPDTFAATLVGEDEAWTAQVANLRATLAGMRTELQPETIEAIEENLRIIDAAIEDARAALAADPASDFLLRRITIYKQTKLDVLRAATSAVVTSDI
jgi:hypothetical protein